MFERVPHQELKRVKSISKLYKKHNFNLYSIVIRIIQVNKILPHLIFSILPILNSYSLKDEIKNIDIKYDVYDDHAINRDMHHNKEFLHFFGDKEKHFVVEATNNARLIKQEALRSNILHDPAKNEKSVNRLFKI